MLSKQPIHDNVIYSREEAAEALGISLSTLKRLIQTGQLKASQPNGLRRMFIKGSSIIEMLNQTLVQSQQ